MLWKKRLEEIANEANKYSKKDILTILRDEWIELIVWDLSSVWKWNISWATLFSKSDNKFKIYVNSNDDRKRQNFTIAHELWHYFLHKPFLKKNWWIEETHWLLLRTEDYFTLEPSELERELEANEFAWNLLMPKEKVLEYKRDWYTNAEMAIQFWVSEQALLYRLYNLGV